MWQPQGFYNEFILRTPAMLSGEESVRGLYNYPASRIAVIHGSSFADKDFFSSTFSKRECVFFDRSWKGEPSFEGLQETIAALEDFKPDTIVAVGGGSVIDGSKLCRLFYEFPSFDTGASRVNGSQMKSRFIAVPTTVGSGAEVSSAAVYYDDKNDRKDMVIMHELQPDVVVYDPRYIYGTPIRLLCASALDATAHILEGYVSKIDNAFADALAEKGLSVLHEELDSVVSNRHIDYVRLQYAGYLGGMVQNHCIVGAAHAIAHQLTRQGYSHGEAVSLLLLPVIRMNMANENCIDKYETISKRSGFKGIEDMLTFINGVIDYAGISDRRIDLIEYLSKVEEDTVFCKNVVNDRGGKGNPVEITGDYIKQLIRSM